MIGASALVQSGAEGEQQRLVVRERHAVCVPRVTTDFGDEAVLVLCAGLEPALAMKHLVPRLLAPNVRGARQRQGKTVATARQCAVTTVLSAPSYRTQSWSMSMATAAGLYW